MAMRPIPFFGLALNAGITHLRSTGHTDSIQERLYGILHAASVPPNQEFFTGEINYLLRCWRYIEAVIKMADNYRFLSADNPTMLPELALVDTDTLYLVTLALPETKGNVLTNQVRRHARETTKLMAGIFLQPFSRVEVQVLVLPPFPGSALEWVDLWEFPFETTPDPA